MKTKTTNTTTMLSEMAYPCPCCFNLTLSSPTHDTYEICPVCWWEHDPVQFNDPTFSGGANTMSLNQARETYLTFGSSSKEFMQHVRKPLPNEIP